MARKPSALLALVLLVALSACGGGGSPGGAVDVTLTDYDVILSPMSVSAGTVDFAIDNRGGFAHEVLLVRSDLSVDELPKTADGRFDEEAAGVRVIAEARDIPAGGTMELVEKLDAGGYYLLCNLPAEVGDPLSHFAHLMYAPFAVT
ncbi:MAG: hypothetical protein ACXW2C_03440 [Acidimicrobiia bacterium]